MNEFENLKENEKVIERNEEVNKRNEEIERIGFWKMS